MPFIAQEKRSDIANFTGKPEVPGDFCYVEYKKLIQAWKAERRWSTVDKMLARFWPQLDQVERAKILAFAVFIVDEVMDYEREMKTENGPVE